VDRQPIAISEVTERFRDRTVIVVGDALLDSWLLGTPHRLCREAPVPVVDIARVEYAAGGGANTAVNVAALGARSILVTAIGADADAESLRRCLAEAGVELRVAVVPQRPTVSKRRLVADGQILVRFDEGVPPPPLTCATRRAMCDAFTDVMDEADAVVVCDYGAGVLDAQMRNWLTTIRHRIPLLVIDAHDLSRWAPVCPTAVTPNFEEARRLLNGDAGEAPADRVAWAGRVAHRLLEGARARIVAVTLDVDGSVVLERRAPPHRTYAEPAPSSQTAGAGDAYLAALTLALASGADPPIAAETAQLAATAAVRRPGTAVCSVAALHDVAQEADRRTVDPQQLVVQLAGHRAQGRRVVFTNGCFDVLHRGHVAYLNQAKRLGDVLVVAVNSDASVRRLKGPGRPVNPVEDRAAVLAALSCVDYVVVFEEDSPAALIEAVRPDIYVKGGDYTLDMIPERALVEAIGGQVRVLDYVADRSTTAIIERIRSSE